MFPALHCEAVNKESIPGTSGLLPTDSIASGIVFSLYM